MAMFNSYVKFRGYIKSLAYDSTQMRRDWNTGTLPSFIWDHSEDPDGKKKLGPTWKISEFGCGSNIGITGFTDRNLEKVAGTQEMGY